MEHGLSYFQPVLAHYAAGSKTTKQKCSNHDITQQTVLEERYGSDIGLHQALNGHRVQARSKPGAKVADDKKQHGRTGNSENDSCNAHIFSYPESNHDCQRKTGVNTDLGVVQAEYEITQQQRQKGNEKGDALVRKISPSKSGHRSERLCVWGMRQQPEYRNSEYDQGQGN